eukprot:jgi/Astpho2/1640/fgenesh1_pm.00030_%23_4_t
MERLGSNDFRPGVTIEMDGAPWRVQEFLHVKPGKGAAFVRSKLKNYLTGNTVEKTFRAGESVESALVERSPTQFTYADGEDYVFMNMETYEETRLRKDDSWAKYMVEGMDVSLLTWNGKVISVDPPPVVELEVVQSDPGAKGNTASGGGSKPATLSSGAEIMVPLFISEGTKVKVDTRTNTYAGRGST